MSSPQHQKERLKGQLQREIAWAIASQLRDPRVPPVVTITDLKVADDYRNATVYVSILAEDKERQNAVTALNSAAPFVQRLVASRVPLKHFPRLCFKLDRSIDRSQRINDLLEEVQDDLV